MKLKIEELVKDNYYLFGNKGYNSMFYFRFEKYEDGLIYSYNYEFKEVERVITYELLSNKHFCTLMAYKNANILEKVDPSLFYKYYPKNHIHLIEYRKQKIISLLKHTL